MSLFFGLPSAQGQSQLSPGPTQASSVTTAVPHRVVYEDEHRRDGRVTGDAGRLTLTCVGRRLSLEGRWLLTTTAIHAAGALSTDWDAQGDLPDSYRHPTGPTAFLPDSYRIPISGRDRV
jgi:hypothetical protein